MRVITLAAVYFQLFCANLGRIVDINIVCKSARIFILIHFMMCLLLLLIVPCSRASAQVVLTVHFHMAYQSLENVTNVLDDACFERPVN